MIARAQKAAPGEFFGALAPILRDLPLDDRQRMLDADDLADRLALLLAHLGARGGEGCAERTA